MKQRGQGSNEVGSEDGIAVLHMDVVQAHRQLERQNAVLVPVFFGALMQQVSTLQPRRKVKAGFVVEYKESLAAHTADHWMPCIVEFSPDYNGEMLQVWHQPRRCTIKKTAGAGHQLCIQHPPYTAGAG